MKYASIRILKVLTGVLFIGVLYFIIRNTILEKVARQKTNRFNISRSAKIRYDEVCFDGFRTIRIESLLVTPGTDDTLLFAGTIKATLNLWQMAGGHLRFRKILISNSDTHLNLKKTNEYILAFSKSPAAHATDSTEVNYYLQINRILKRGFDNIPSDIILQDAAIHYSIDSLSAGVYFDSFRMKHGIFHSAIQLVTNHLKQYAVIKGKVRPRQHSIEIKINSPEVGTLLKSPAAFLAGTDMRYKSISIAFSQKSKRSKEITLQGNYTLENVEISHNTLSRDTIRFPGCSANLNVSLGTNFIELDSISQINVGKLRMHPYLKYTLNASDSLRFSCFIPAFTVNDFFTSLPAGLFPHLKGIEAEGSVSYRAELLIDLNRPDSLYLASNLMADDFKLKEINSELIKMNRQFIHTVYEKGKPVRTIVVGPDNPDFCSLNEIPELLQNAVLIAEDGSFYGHRGFLISAVRRAIAENIKEKKLYRGGSTISQQLIKNTYLNRDKTLSRKLEEVILVWLIESNRLVSKSRMFEVYLNIIEWGPNVYGVREATRFYFNKKPDQLSASECIFLASVIPSPKKFYWRFDEAGNLAPFMLAYYSDMSKKMLNRNLITSANGDSLASVLNIIGPARQYLRFRSIPADSLPAIEMNTD